MSIKNRSTLFAVVRVQYEDNEGPGLFDPTIVGVYSSLLRAEEIAGTYSQEMEEKGFGDMFTFEVQASTYYDE